MSRNLRVLKEDGKVILKGKDKCKDLEKMAAKEDLKVLVFPLGGDKFLIELVIY